MAASTSPGITGAEPAPAPYLLAGTRILLAGDPPPPPPRVVAAAAERLPRGGAGILAAPGGEWLVLPVTDPCPALALAPAAGARERAAAWGRAWRPVLRDRLAAALADDPWLRLLSGSPSLAPVIDPLRRAAPTMLPVLLGGESGTGKEEAVRALHAASGRGGPLVAENCAALPGSLLEAELFGVRRGAFTGADRDRDGRFTAAHGGTLFLDEIAELPLPLQGKLLRALEEGTIRPLGGDRPRPVDVRIVAATRRDLRRMVREGEFREDLYWRLAGLEVVLPPLRERRADLPYLAAALLPRVRDEGLGPGRHLGPGALRVLEGHPFPGNVRELLQVLRRSVLLAAGPEIPAETVRRCLGPAAAATAPRRAPDALARHEEGVIREALASSGGNKARAARLLGWSRQRLYRRMAALGIARSYASPADSRARSISRSSRRG